MYDGLFMLYLVMRRRSLKLGELLLLFSLELTDEFVLEELEYEDVESDEEYEEEVEEDTEGDRRDRGRDVRYLDLES